MERAAGGVGRDELRPTAEFGDLERHVRCLDLLAHGGHVDEGRVDQHFDRRAFVEELVEFGDDPRPEVAPTDDDDAPNAGFDDGGLRGQQGTDGCVGVDEEQ